MGFEIKARKESEPVTAVINYVWRSNKNGDNRRYASCVTYSYKGKVYKDVKYESTSKPPKIREGHTVKIYVNKENPRKIKTSEPIILIGILAFFEIAFIIAVIAERSEKKSASVE